MRNGLRSREPVLLAWVVAAGVVFSLTSPFFLTFTNLSNIAVQSSMILLIAFGMTVVIIAGGIDLSVGSAAAVVAVCTVWLIAHAAVAAPVAILIGLGVGALIGATNGVIISKLRVPDFVATLAMLTGLRGVAFLIAGGFAIRSTDPQLAFVANGRIGPIPVPIIAVAVAFVAVHFMLAHTTFGRALYAVGGNQHAARLAGLSISRPKIGAYMIVGALTAVAGIIGASRTAAGSPILGTGWELQAIAIVILGGTNLFGGAGGVTGTLLAGLLLGMTNNWMSLTGLSWWLQGVVVGTLLILVVALNQRQLRRKTLSLNRELRKAEA
jgi:ribose transport system permease protein